MQDPRLPPGVTDLDVGSDEIEEVTEDDFDYTDSVRDLES